MATPGEMNWIDFGRRCFEFELRLLREDAGKLFLDRLAASDLNTV
jgi:hypothetical protein